MSVPPLIYPVGFQARACDQLRTPVYMLGLGVSLMKQYFGEDDRISVDTATFKWKQDQGASELYINTADNLDYDVIGKRASIIVELGQVNYPKKVIGDTLDFDVENQAISILDISEGSWEFLCFSNQPLEAWSLAQEVKFFLQTYRQYIASTFKLDTVRVMNISKHQKMTEYRDLYACSVSVIWKLQDNFLVGEESLKASAIKLNLCAV